MSNLTKRAEVELEVFRQLCDHYRQDIRLFWARSNFYTVVNGALMSAFAITFKAQTVGAMVTISVLAAMGIATCVLWRQSTIASLAWIKVWKQKVADANGVLQKASWYGGVLVDGERNASQFSSVITIRLPVVMGSAWAILLIVALVQTIILISGIPEMRT